MARGPSIAGDDDPVDGGGNPVSVVTVGKRKYAVSVQWRKLLENEPVTEAVKTAKGTGVDLYVSLKNFDQVGFGSRSWGHRMGMPCLAASFVAGLKKNGLSSGIGLFEVGPELYWVIGQNDNGIISETDIVYTDRSQAVEAFMSTLGQRDDWGGVYAPENALIADTVDLPIQEAIPAKPVKGGRLAEIGQKTVYLATTAAVVILAGLYLCWNLYKDHEQGVREARREAQEAAKQAMIHERYLQSLKYKTPWSKAPVFSTAMTVCTHAIQTLPKPAPGWQNSLITCNGSQVVDTFVQRSNVQGTIAWMDETFPGVPVQWKGNLATVSWTIEGAPVDGRPTSLPSEIGQTPLPNLSWATEWVSARLQESFQTFGVTPGKAPVVGATAPNAPLYYPSVLFSIKTNENPNYLLAIFGQIPALVLTEISYRPASGIWSVHAKMYGPPGKPVAPR